MKNRKSINLYKHINTIFLYLLLLSSCHRKTIGEILDKDPSYKIIRTFSERIKTERGLILRSYALNTGLPKDYKFKNRTANFSTGYSLAKKKNDSLSLEEARALLVVIAEDFLKEINSNEKVIPQLDTFPLTSDQLKITIRFEDENKIDLGQGVAIAYLYNGIIKYEGYNISEYTGSYPAIGEHYLIHEETYAEALEALKKPDAPTNSKEAAGKNETPSPEQNIGVEKVIDKESYCNLIKKFSDGLDPKSGLTLRSYNVNHNLPKDYQIKNGIANFQASYSFNGKLGDAISTDQARIFLFYISENLLEIINSEEKLISGLDVFPLTYNQLDIAIHFEDDKRTELPQGITKISLRDGKITYQGYAISERPTSSKRIIHRKEAYSEGFEIVSKTVDSFEQKNASDKEALVSKYIEQETNTLSKLAQQIIQKNNPRLKQIHVTFSNMDFVFDEALKNIPLKYRDTAIVMTTGRTVLLDQKLAHQVYNIIGDQKFASEFSRGKMGSIETAKNRANVVIVESRDPNQKDHISSPDYQERILDITNKISRTYEIQ